MKNKTKRQSAQNIVFQDIAFCLKFNIYELELLLLYDLFLVIFESVIENKSKIDDRRIKKNLNYLVCKAGLWDYAKFYKIVDSRIQLDLFN